MWPRLPQDKKASLDVSWYSGATRIRLASKKFVHQLFLSFAKKGAITGCMSVLDCVDNLFQFI
jgi:hypothetical protein